MMPEIYVQMWNTFAHIFNRGNFQVFIYLPLQINIMTLTLYLLKLLFESVLLMFKNILDNSIYLHIQLTNFSVRQCTFTIFIPIADYTYPIF